MRALLGGLCLTFLVAGCTTEAPPVAPRVTASPVSTPSTPRALWEQREPASYEMTLTYTSMIGPRPLRIRVVDGRVVSSRDLRRGGVPHAGSDLPVTVDGVFELLAADQRTADEVRVAYDERWGFPSSVAVDPEKSSIDEEHGYGISHFVALR